MEKENVPEIVELFCKMILEDKLEPVEILSMEALLKPLADEAEQEIISTAKEKMAEHGMNRYDIPLGYGNSLVFKMKNAYDSTTFNMAEAKKALKEANYNLDDIRFKKVTHHEKTVTSTFMTASENERNDD